MTTIAFHLGCWLLGLLWLMPASRRIGIPAALALAYPLGMVSWVALAVLLVALPIAYGPVSIALGLVVLGSIGGARALPALRALDARSIGIVCCAGLGWGALVGLIDRVPISVLSYDSWASLVLSHSIAVHGGIEPDLGMGAHGLDDRGLFQVMVQSAAPFLGAPLLHSAVPIATAAFLAAFAVLACRAIDGPRAPRAVTLALVGLTLASISSVYFVVVQTFYVHDNLPSGIYLALFAACYWLGEVEEADSWLVIALVFLWAFAVHRAETPFAAMLFAACVAARSRASGAALGRGLAVFCVGLWLWYAHLWVAVDPTQNWNPRRALLIPAVLVAVPALGLGAWLVRLPALAALRPRVPELALAGALALCVVGLAVDRELMTRSWGFLFGNMLDASWGGVWIAMPVLAVATCFAPRLPSRWIFTAAWLAYFFLICAIPLGKGSYRHGWGDSGNRMLTHLLPMAFFYFAVVFGRASMPPTESVADSEPDEGLRATST